MSTFDGNAALLSKDIDAQVSANDLFPLQDRGVARVIYSSRGEISSTRLDHLLVTEEFEAKYPSIVQRLVNQVLKVGALELDEGDRTNAYQVSDQERS